MGFHSLVMTISVLVFVSESSWSIVCAVSTLLTKNHFFQVLERQIVVIVGIEKQFWGSSSHLTMISGKVASPNSWEKIIIDLIGMHFQLNFTLNEPKSNWNTIHFHFNAWYYSVDYYKVGWIEKVKNGCISTSPISQAAQQKYHCEYNVPEKFAYIWQNSILHRETKLETIRLLNDANLMHSFSHL